VVGVVAAGVAGVALGSPDVAELSAALWIGRLAAAMIDVSTNTAEAVRPLATIRAPAATCGRRLRGGRAVALRGTTGVWRTRSARAAAAAGTGTSKAGVEGGAHAPAFAAPPVEAERADARVLEGSSGTCPRLARMAAMRAA
jgi:hypothetical protein